MKKNHRNGVYLLRISFWTKPVCTVKQYSIIQFKSPAGFYLEGTRVMLTSGLANFTFTLPWLAEFQVWLLGQMWRGRLIFWTRHLNVISSETTGSINESSGHFLAVFVLTKRESFRREDWHLHPVVCVTKTGSHFEPKHCVLLNKTRCFCAQI